MTNKHNTDIISLMPIVTEFITVILVYDNQKNDLIPVNYWLIGVH